MASAPSTSVLQNETTAWDTFVAEYTPIFKRRVSLFLGLVCSENGEFANITTWSHGTPSNRHNKIWEALASEYLDRWASKDPKGWGTRLQTLEGREKDLKEVKAIVQASFQRKPGLSADAVRKSPSAPCDVDLDSSYNTELRGAKVYFKEVKRQKDSGTSDDQIVEIIEADDERRQTWGGTWHEPAKKYIGVQRKLDEIDSRCPRSFLPISSYRKSNEKNSRRAAPY